MKKYSVKELRKLAMDDDTDDNDSTKHWHYTDKCHYCGGTKCFIDWIEDNERIENLKTLAKFKNSLYAYFEDDPIFYRKIDDDIIECFIDEKPKCFKIIVKEVDVINE